jgi:hypothetical protein
MAAPKRMEILGARSPLLWRLVWLALFVIAGWVDLERAATPSTLPDSVTAAIRANPFRWVPQS